MRNNTYIFDQLQTWTNSMLYTSAAVQIIRENTPLTQNCAKENHFRFRSAILEIGRGPLAGHGTVNRFEIEQQTTQIWRDDTSDEVGAVHFYLFSTRRIFERGIGFETVPGVREGFFDELGLV